MERLHLAETEHWATQGLVCEVPVKDMDFPVPSAFNDMSLHFFLEAKLRSADCAMWESPSS